MVSEAFGGPGVVEESQDAKAGVGGSRWAGPTVALAGSHSPCKVALEAAGRAEVWGAASFPVESCSEAGLASL